MNDQIRAAIIGLGRSGWNIHGATLEDHPSYTVAAAADPVPERRAEAADRFGCATYAEPEDLIGHDDIDLVILATPSLTHTPLAIAAVAAGHHVVVEKPVATSLTDLDTMIAAAQAAGRILTGFQPRRADPDLLAVRAVIDSGRLGELVLVRRTMHRYVRRSDWQTLSRQGGGELLNTMPHLIDQALAFLAPTTPINVLADLRHTIGAGDTEDHVKLILQPTSVGPVVDLESSCCVAIAQAPWYVVGTAGALTGDATTLCVRSYDSGVWAPITADDGPAVQRRYGSGETLEASDGTVHVRPAERSPWQQFYDLLADAITNGTRPPVTIEDLRWQLGIIERARGFSQPPSPA